MKKIKMKKGYVALVDDDDYEKLKDYNWYYSNGYAVTTLWLDTETHLFDRDGIVIHMHRVINNTPDNMQTDHINGNKLDNRKKNLRSCTHQQNMCNRPIKPSKIGYKGVKVKGKKYYANITYNYNKIYLGSFPTAEEAAKAYDKAAKQYHGEFASLNFS